MASREEKLQSSIQAEASPEEQLMVLRGLTQTTEVVHDAQIFQLKNWGRLAFDDFMTRLEFEVDPEQKFVEYRGKIKGKLPKRATRRFEAVKRSVKWLFGDEWVTRVKVGKTVIFK
jgi:hypothetical protein